MAIKATAEKTVKPQPPKKAKSNSESTDKGKSSSKKKDSTKASDTTAASSSSMSKGKKRVRVLDTEEVKDLPSSSPHKASNGKAKDLREKSLEEIEPIVSAEARKPDKGVLKHPDTDLDEDEDNEENEEDGEIDFLKGFESDEDGEDSSDEEDDEDDGAGTFTVESLPTIVNSNSKEDKMVQKKLEAKAERKKNAVTGTIYLGRIPHGFHEEEMKSYFSQFGEITRLRLSRNKKTGRSKHYAFIEFQYESVAKIVQETMDNYLLAGHILVCKVVPNHEIHPKLWLGANRKFKVIPRARMDNSRRTAPKTPAQKESLKARLLRREESKRAQLAALGIEYDFKGYRGANDVSASKSTNKTEEKDIVKVAKGKGDSKIEGGHVVDKKTKKPKVIVLPNSDEPAKKKSRKSV